MTIEQIIRDANQADAAFEAAIKAAGFKSRWNWDVCGTDRTILAAYRAKVDADQAMHAAFAKLVEV